MKQGKFRGAVLLAVIILLSGCANSTIDMRGGHEYEPMISAADFDAMISVEVRELEPLPANQAVVSAN